MGVSITEVRPGSPAARRGLQAGDILLSVGGHAIEDVLDYRFYTTEDTLTLAYEREGRRFVVRLHKAADEDVGLEFATYLMDKHRTCRNQCVFCFIDQMPPGMRPSLYEKDDDSRLSFLLGNYITLTNLSQREIERILEMHISPLNVSVHTTNPELRCQMMHNRYAGDRLSLLKTFADAGIRLRCQLVLCPGINDGPELTRTLSDLAALVPAVESVAVVPVGLTRFREGLPALRAFTAAEAAAVVDQIQAAAQDMLQRHNTRIFYASDEFYLCAGRPFPPAADYEAFTQWENGVGMWPLLSEQFDEALAACTRPPRGSRMTLATGAAAAPLMAQLVARASTRWPALCTEVVAIRNRFFGETITVAGLVTGGDLIDQLRGRVDDRLLIPHVMLRHEGDVFLDDVSLDDVRRALGVPITVVGGEGTDLLRALWL